MSILSGFRKQKKYIKESSGNFKLVSNWTSSDTVDIPLDIQNEEKPIGQALEWDSRFNQVQKVSTLSSLVTKLSIMFNNIKFLNNRTESIDPKVQEQSTCDLNDFISSGIYILTGDQVTTRVNFPINQPGKLTVTTWREESNNQTFCRQDFDRYSTGENVCARFSRIGILNSSGGTWTWNQWYSDAYFAIGESYTIPSGTLAVGYVEKDRKYFWLNVVLPKSRKGTRIASSPATLSFWLACGDENAEAQSYTWMESISNDNNLKIRFRTTDSSIIPHSNKCAPICAMFNENCTITFA